jgi:hypothetical protein
MQARRLTTSALKATAYSAATATGKNEGPASGPARGHEFGAAAPQPAATAAAGEPNFGGV